MSQSKRRRTSPSTSTQPRNALPLILLGLIVLVAAVFFALRNNSEKAGSGGTPRVSVDKKQLDFGDQHFGQSVAAIFSITNTGTGTLKINQPPYIEVKEGC